MYKIAVLGDYDSIYGFAALGLDTFPEEDPEEAARKLHELAGGGRKIRPPRLKSRLRRAGSPARAKE